MFISFITIRYNLSHRYFQAQSTMFRLLSLKRHLCSTAKQIRYRFEHGSFMAPHPEKAYKGGQDALYASDNVLLVADGVGGWADSGVDPALYSKRLVKIMEELVQKDSLKYIDNPKSLVKEAVQLNKQTGSTTVCLVTLHPQTGVIKAYYLGDSVYGIFNMIKSQVRIAPDQQYEFNFPVQVGTGGANPQHGVFHQYKPEQIEEQDRFVIATDGIWDNVSPQMIYQILLGQQLPNAAKDIAEYASFCGKQNNYESPFYLKAQKAGINFPKQGKLDDCSVIVANIIKEQL